MTVLGVLILLAVGLATATVVANGNDDATLNMVGLDIQTSIAGIYAIGALNLLLAVLGVVLLLGGAKRSRRRRKEVKDLRKKADRDPEAAQSGAGQGRPADEPQRPPGGGTGRDDAGSGGARPGSGGPGSAGHGGDDGDHHRSPPRD